VLGVVSGNIHQNSSACLTKHVDRRRDLMVDDLFFLLISDPDIRLMIKRELDQGNFAIY